MVSITYTKQDDGTFLKQGEFATVPSEVRIACGDQPPGGSAYTLARAIEIIEEGIAKGQVRHSKYSIILVEGAKPEKEPKPPKPAKEPKPPKEPKAPKAPKPPKDPNAPAPERKTKYDVNQFVTLYVGENKTIEEVMAATGASYPFIRWTLKNKGVLRPTPPKVKKAAAQEEPAPAATPAVETTSEPTTTAS